MAAKIKWEDFVAGLPPQTGAAEVEAAWRKAAGSFGRKILVLDDDPTGVQTVHGIPVYTRFDKAAMQQIREDKSNIVYILTNSRALTGAETEKLHQEIAGSIVAVFPDAADELVIVSRSDSTLRGHYPLETLCLFGELGGPGKFDGEIIIPAFFEGGRYTYRDIHYVKEGDWLVPAGDTEFARDATFGYSASDLKEWVAEKTQGKFPANTVISIGLDLLRSGDAAAVAAILGRVTGFNKVIVNATDYYDLKVFFIGLTQAMAAGKRFLFRTAAAIVPVLGGLEPKPLLTKETLYPQGIKGAGLIIVGSHVQKTTRQLAMLATLPNLKLIEFDVATIVDNVALDAEQAGILRDIDAAFSAGRDVCLYTSRKLHKVDDSPAGRESNLHFSTRVSAALVTIVRKLTRRPGFIVAKGGITSSDIGVKGLAAVRSMVLGQILPGIPVWELGDESAFPGLPYVVFPGNVGGEDALKKVVEILRS